jgi:outer membrane usher protein
MHAEAMAGQATLGLGGDYLIARVGTVSAYLAGSHRATDSGGLLLLGIDRLTPFWSFGARTQKTTAGFAQVGDALHHALPSQVSSANLSCALGEMGSVGVAYISQIRHDQTDARILSLSYGVGVGGTATLSVSALANLTGEQNTRLVAMLSVPLGASVSVGASAQASRTHGGNTLGDYTAMVQQNLPSGSGYGYRLQTRSPQSTQGALALQSDVGTYTLDAIQDHSATATQISASGGLALIGGRVFASRRIDQSFAVATVAGYPNVRVLADNQPAGHTDANGNALIPRLRAYDRNTISIDQRDLPMDAEIGALSVNATPYFRSGAAVTFPIQRAHAATFTVVLEDGDPLPAGAVLTMAGESSSALLGTSGEVYARDLHASNAMRVQWRGQQCEFVVPYASGDDPLPDLGTFVCKGVRR